MNCDTLNTCKIIWLFLTNKKFRELLRATISYAIKAKILWKSIGHEELKLWLQPHIGEGSSDVVLFEAHYGELFNTQSKMPTTQD